jgi:hypothetical protein
MDSLTEISGENHEVTYNEEKKVELARWSWVNMMLGYLSYQTEGQHVKRVTCKMVNLWESIHTQWTYVAFLQAVP